MHLKAICTFFIVSLLSVLGIYAQAPKYTPTALVSFLDTAEFKITGPKKDGLIKTYVTSRGQQIFDLDDEGKTFIMDFGTSVVCFEGNIKNGQKEGVFTGYVIDSLDHKKRYKIYEQEYTGDKLNGLWKTYTLKGTLYSISNFKNDSINGLTRNYWVDGKRVISEKIYVNGHSRYTAKEYDSNEVLSMEIQYENEKKNGYAKRYYENGVLQDSAGFRNDMINGVRKYFYPNGQVWIEEIYKDGKDWTVVANYTDKGKKRNAGTLKNGNGTIIFYDEDGSERETKTFVNGREKK